MNYQIINRPEELKKFINSLPELEHNEGYYLSLVARKKYHESAVGTQPLAVRLIKNKDYLYREIKKLEAPLGCYMNGDNVISQKALALYITITPRDFGKARKNFLKILVEDLCNGSDSGDVIAKARSSTHKAKAKSIYTIFDFDTNSSPELLGIFDSFVNRDACHVVHTRGGFHLLINKDLVEEEYTKSWYLTISSLKECDAVSVDLTPVPGCCQGDYTPTLEL